MDRKPLNTWIHPSHCVILLGDSCHPMLVSLVPYQSNFVELTGPFSFPERPQPYRAQGAAMAIEDAAVLGNLLSRLAHPDQLPILLQAYQDLRLPRTAETQNQSRLNQKIFHLPDGPEQEQRDADMRRAAELELARTHNGKLGGDAAEGSSNQWADERKSKIQFGYDADEAADQWWRDGGERALQQVVAEVKVNGDANPKASPRL